MKSNAVKFMVWSIALLAILTPVTARAELPPCDCCEPCEVTCDTRSWFDHDCGSRFRLAEINIYPTFSYRGAESATYNEFEFASFTDVGCWEMENRTVLNVADLPSTIKLGPTNPGDEPTTVNVRGSGFGDVLSGFFFGRKDAHRNYHLRIGPVITFPTASNDILGSNQYTAGPGVHYSTEIGRLTAGFFVWQS